MTADETDSDSDDWGIDQAAISLRRSTALTHFQSAVAELDLAVEELERLEELYEEDPIKFEGDPPVEDEAVDRLRKRVDRIGELVESDGDDDDDNDDGDDDD